MYICIYKDQSISLNFELSYNEQTLILIFFGEKRLEINKPEQAIELHGNPKGKIKICLKVIDLGQNQIPEKISPGKFLHPETPQTM